MTLICDHCMAKKVKEEKVTPHFKVFGQNTRWYYAKCDHCGRTADCVLRQDVHREVENASV